MKNSSGTTGPQDGLPSELLQALVSNVNAIVVTLGKNAKILSFNRFAEKLTGYKAAEVIGKGWINIFIPKQQRKEILSVFNAFVKEKKSSLPYTNPIITKSGKERIIEWSSTAVAPEKGGTLIISIGCDITEQKRTEASFAESYRRYIEILDLSPDFIVVVSRLGKLLFANKQALSSLGYTKKEGIGQPISAFLSKNSLKQAAYMIAKEFAGKIQPSAELELKKKNGGSVFIETAPGTSFIQDISFLGGKHGEPGLLVSAHDITKRKKVEGALQQSELFLNSIIENIPLLLFAKSAKDMRYIIANKAVLDFFGKKRENFIGMTDIEVFPPGTAEEFRKQDRKVLASRKALDIPQNTVHRPDGTRYMHVIKVPVLNSAGKPAYLLGISEDITAKKRIEDALRKNDDMMQEAQRVANLGSYCLDIASEKWTSSPLLDEIFGIGNGFKRTVRGWLRLVHPEDRKMMADYLNHYVLGKKRPFDKEYRVVNQKTGQTIWLHGLGQLAFDKNKKPISMFGTIQDITEQKKANLLLQRVIDLLPTRVFWKDKNLTYLGCNKIFANDAGKSSPSEVIGKTDFEMGWKKQAERYRSDDKRVILSGKEKLRFQEPQTTPKGDEIWLRTSKVPLTDLNGEVIGVLGVYDDVTDMKKSEDEAQSRADELERFNRLAIGRELRMIELKKIIKELEEQIHARQEPKGYNNSKSAVKRKNKHNRS